MTDLTRRLSIRLAASLRRTRRFPDYTYTTRAQFPTPSSHLCFARHSSSSATMSTYIPPKPVSQPSSPSTNECYPTFKAALLQLNCQADLQHNLRQVTTLIRQAAASGAKLICTPENTTRLTALSLPFDVHKEGQYEKDHPSIVEYRRLAAELDVWLAIGSVSVRADDDVDKMSNRSLLIAPHTTADSPTLGSIVARYDKVHLFDAPSLTDSEDETYVESKRIRPGRDVPVVLTPFGPVALTVCYDMRFPTLYSRLATLHSPSVILIPAAFTVPTGKAHWETLLRARAIECGCYVLAAAQCGEHTGGRHTYGRSMAVDPWGDVVAVREEATEGVLLVEIDRRKVEETRKRIQSLAHQREFDVVLVDARTAQPNKGDKHGSAEKKNGATTSAL